MMTKKGGGAWEFVGRKVGGVDNELRMQVQNSSNKERAALFHRMRMFDTCKSIEPLPSTSYIRNAHWSFSFGVPADVTSIAHKNSYHARQTNKSIISREPKRSTILISRSLIKLSNSFSFNKTNEKGNMGMR